MECLWYSRVYAADGRFSAACWGPMKISIRVKPNSKENQVEERGPNQLLVKVKAPPQENRANQEVIKILAEYFRIPKSRISIVAGLRSKQKVVEIEEM